MTVVVTMAGLGSRFAIEGYSVPKYQIKAHGKSLFEWSLLSLSRFFDQQFIFAMLGDGDQDWTLSHASKLGIRNIRVVSRQALSKGQAETAYDVIDLVDDDDDQFWIYNIDTSVDQGCLDPTDMAGGDGCLHVFNSIKPNMSFVAYDGTDNVSRVAEKEVISSWASLGLYGFRSAVLYRDVFTSVYRNTENMHFSGEMYIAPMYNELISSGLVVKAPKIEAAAVNILGTPNELLAFDCQAVPPLGHK